MDDQDIAGHVTNQVGVIGEKIELAEYAKLEAETVIPYIHMGYRAGVIGGLNQKGDAAEEAGRNVAMQIAAMKPSALDKEGVDKAVIDREIEIGKEQARPAGKPENIIDRIAEGKLNRFFEDNRSEERRVGKERKLE